MHPKQTDYDRASRARKREAGLVKVEVWVPKERRQDLIDHAKKLREGVVSVR